MYLVDEQHILRLQRGEDASEVTRFVEDRAAGDLESHAQFVGDDVAQGRLAQARRAVEQGVVQRFAAVLGGFHKHAQVVDHLLLTREILEAQGAQGLLEVVGSRSRASPRPPFEGGSGMYEVVEFLVQG